MRWSQVVRDSGVLMSIELPGTASQVIEAVGALGLEGVIVKRRDSKYEVGERSGGWVKLKLDKQQNFVVGGLQPNGAAVDADAVGLQAVKQLREAWAMGVLLTQTMSLALYAATNTFSAAASR